LIALSGALMLAGAAACSRQEGPAETVAGETVSGETGAGETLAGETVAGSTYHIDLDYGGRDHYWRVLFANDYLVGQDGPPELVVDYDGPAVLGAPGDGPLVSYDLDIYATDQAEWRWRQDGASLELWNERGRFPGRYRGAIAGDTIVGTYEEEGGRGSFVMTRAD
ncbi:MAG: hypothetical protein ACT4OF_00295, partial [Caulobacteraceae bacterium]